MMQRVLDCLSESRFIPFIGLVSLFKTGLVFPEGLTGMEGMKGSGTTGHPPFALTADLLFACAAICRPTARALIIRLMPGAAAANSALRRSRVNSPAGGAMDRRRKDAGAENRPRRDSMLPTPNQSQPGGHLCAWILPPPGQEPPRSPLAV